MASTISSACDLSSPYKIAVQSSTAIYGANVLLGTSCLYLLVSSTLLRKDQLTKVVALCLYVSAMLGFASQTIVHVSQIMLGEASGIPGQLPYLPPGTTIWGVVQFSAMSLPFVILGTNGFMVWRCFVLYQGLSAPKRTVISVYLGALVLATLGSGIYFLVAYYSPYGIRTQDGKFDDIETVNGSIRNQSILSLLAVTAVSNISASVLITARLLYAHRLLRKSFPVEKSPYLNAIALCVESSALVTVCAIILTVISITGLKLQASFDIMTAILPQICVFSPLLILYRISLGRETSISCAEETLLSALNKNHLG